jgi:hypothetical protein
MIQLFVTITVFISTRDSSALRNRESSPMLSAVNAENFDSDSIESPGLAEERDSPLVYLPSPLEIETLKRQIRSENEAKQASEDGPPYLNMYRHPRILKTGYSQGRIRTSSP